VGLAVAVLSCGSRTMPEHGIQYDLGCTTANPDVSLPVYLPTHQSLSSNYTYGSPQCPRQYVAELTFPESSGLYVSGIWLPDYPATQCDFHAVMNLFGRPRDETSWRIVDQVITRGVLDSEVCTAHVVFRYADLPASADGDAPYGYAPPDVFDALRIAVKATDGAGDDAPIIVDFFYPTP
jgi:hypothetical protein